MKSKKYQGVEFGTLSAIDKAKDLAKTQKAIVVLAKDAAKGLEEGEEKDKAKRSCLREAGILVGILFAVSVIGGVDNGDAAWAMKQARDVGCEGILLATSKLHNKVMQAMAAAGEL